MVVTPQDSDGRRLIRNFQEGDPEEIVAIGTFCYDRLLLADPEIDIRTTNLVRSEIEGGDGATCYFAADDECAVEELCSTAVDDFRPFRRESRAA
jgi:hypothetical protein